MTTRSISSTAVALLVALTLSACEQPEPVSSNQPAAAAEAAAGTISASELAERIDANDAPLILDVRTADEFAAGHIPGAMNITHTEVGERLSELPADRSAEIVVHCQSGRRASMAETILAEAGFTGVRHLEGDWAGWQAAGLPVEP